ncbi:MAG: DUF4397 domain-containing protein [Actinobacteria bacterium]|nr:DUF4397 domain-containing protein [Actinomycetota bacterium]
MIVRQRARGSITACAMVMLSTVMPPSPASASTPMAPGEDATVSVLHAIPTGLGADVVDVYAGRALIIDDLTPGTLKTVKLPGGTYALTVLQDGRTLGGGAPLLRVAQTNVPSGANVTITANLDAEGRPALNYFTNDTSTVGRGMGRLTVRHIAFAPALDIRNAGRVLFTGLRNPRQADAGLNAGRFAPYATVAGTRDVVLRPTPITITNKPGTSDMGTNTIVYLWGSLVDGSLRAVVQNVRIDLQ